MAHYLVTAKPRKEKIDELRQMLDRDEIRSMRPFGGSLHESLDNARLQPNGYAVWEELDYCNPPLAMERAAVLDEFFTDLSVENVQSGQGWRRIQDLPSLWTASHHDTAIV